MSGGPRTAIIGGSGFQRLPGFQVERRENEATPFGEVSDAPTVGRLAGRDWVFLRRHGAEHRIPPHRINYRANIWALKEAGVERIVAFAAVGAIDAGLAVSGIVIPHQIIDYTWGRAHTFFDGQPGAPGGLGHIDFSRPYSEALRGEIIASAPQAGVNAASAAVYAVTQGPRLESAAEINRLERDGADIVGMTGMPEAALARELDMEYATIAIVVNAAAGRGRGAIDLAGIAGHPEAGAGKALAINANP